MSILEYIVWGIGIIIAIGWCVNVREKAGREQATEKTSELAGFLLSLSVIILPFFNLSPYHLLWMLPASFILGLLSISFFPLRALHPFSTVYFFPWYIGISNEGRRNYLAGDYDKAVIALEKEVAKHPKSANAHFNLALAYGKLGRQEEEIFSYEDAVKLAPEAHQMHLNLGIAHNEMGNKNLAINSLNEAIKLKPDYINAHFTLGKIYVDLGEKEDAMVVYECLKKYDLAASEKLLNIINAV